MSRTPDRFATVRKSRILLRVPEPGDLRDLVALYFDPAVWADDPRSRHTDLGEILQMIERWRDGWKRDGLGMWVVTSREPSSAGQFVRIGGMTARRGISVIACGRLFGGGDWLER